jgi:hypothetical protein
LPCSSPILHVSSFLLVSKEIRKIIHKMLQSVMTFGYNKA